MAGLDAVKAKYGKEDEKEGLNTGRYAVNPLTGDKIPIFIANFVLMEYGTGAIMSVPAHDQRDFEFAGRYGLPVKVVIISEDSAEARKTESVEVKELTEAFEGDGILVASGRFSGLSGADARRKIIEFIEAQGYGAGRINYKLRDWGISRQRYWGTPIPVVYCVACGIVPVPEDQLPVILPEDAPLTGTGASPLAESSAFVNVSCPGCGAPARRETDTMDTFVDSSWYFIRYCSKKNEDSFARGNTDYWMPVDQYIGGIEHAVLHLLYSRFFTLILRDIGIIGMGEPFRNLLTQGMVCKETWKCEEHGWLFPEEAASGVCSHCNKPVDRGRVEKMSKSKKNIVDPDALIQRFGADTLRLFSLFAAPPERDLEWSDKGVEGASRFINKLWTAVRRNSREVRAARAGAAPLQNAAATALLRKTHQTIRKVTDDIEKDYHFNTAIAALMEMVNEISGFLPRDDADRNALSAAIRTVVLLVSPFAPHVAEDLWESTGERGSVFEQPWPEWDAVLAKDAEIELVVQVNGKLRAKILVPAGLSDDAAREMALADGKVAEHTAGRQIVKVVVIQGRLVNIVVK